MSLVALMNQSDHSYMYFTQNQACPADVSQLLSCLALPQSKEYSFICLKTADRKKSKQRKCTQIITSYLVSKAIERCINIYKCCCVFIAVALSPDCNLESPGECLS